MIAVKPLLAAACRGVAPALLSVLQLYPPCKRVETWSEWPLCAAQYSACAGGCGRAVVSLSV